MFSFLEKKAGVDEIASVLALFVLGRAPGMNDDDEFNRFAGSAGFGSIDRSLFDAERRYLRAFAIDYGTAMVFGVNDVKTNVILDAFQMHTLADVRTGKLPPDFMDSLTERFAIYAEAVNTPSAIGPHYEVARVFAEYLGSPAGSLDPFPIVPCAILFCSYIKLVTSLLKSIAIQF